MGTTGFDSWTWLLERLSPIERIMGDEPTITPIRSFNRLDGWPAGTVLADLVMLDQITGRQAVDVVRVHFT